MSFSAAYDTHSDALVFFGATGDLAQKKIFPALYQLVLDRRLEIPIIGVAGSPWSDEQLRARARESVQAHVGSVDAGAFDRFASLLRYVAGHYEDPRTFQLLREALGERRRPLHYLAIPPSMF